VASASVGVAPLFVLPLCLKRVSLFCYFSLLLLHARAVPLIFKFGFGFFIILFYATTLLDYDIDTTLYYLKEKTLESKSEASQKSS
jgi:hypothetical protein